MRLAACILIAAVLGACDQPSATTITVTEATYGAICKDFVPAPPIANLVKVGNATEAVGAVCNKKGACVFTVTAKALGDPAGGCGKDFIVKWRCGTDTKPNQATIAAEASEKSVNLQCPPKASG